MAIPCISQRRRPEAFGMANIVYSENYNSLVAGFGNSCSLENQKQD